MCLVVEIISMKRGYIRESDAKVVWNLLSDQPFSKIYNVKIPNVGLLQVFY
jgi:hypothetical protein